MASSSTRLLRRNQSVGLDSCRRFHGLPACDQPVQHATDRVDVRPWPLPAMRVILFEWGESRRDDGPDIATVRPKRMAHRSEIGQHQAFVFTDQQAGGIDIAM